MKKAQHKRRRVVVTEGVFGMEGEILDVKPFIDLCKKYNALLFMDDCHGTGVIGKTG